MAYESAHGSSPNDLTFFFFSRKGVFSWNYHYEEIFACRLTICSAVFSLYLCRYHVVVGSST